MDTLKQNIIGKVLFFAGAIVAIASGAKMPGAGDTYPDTISLFVLGLIVSIAGNFLWHRTERAIVLAEMEEHKNDTTANPMSLLKQISQAIDGLQKQIDNMTESEVMKKIDDIHAELIHAFVEKRKVMTDVLGQEKAAEILLEVAYGERMLNRTWSAVSDGHFPEAKHSLSESVKSYHQAVAKLD